MWYDTGTILVDVWGLFLNIFDELGCREKSVGEVPVSKWSTSAA